VNEKGQVLGIQSKLDSENRQVVRENKQEGKEWDSQKWDIIFVNEAGKVPT